MTQCGALFEHTHTGKLDYMQKKKNAAGAFFCYLMFALKKYRRVRMRKKLVVGRLIPASLQDLLTYEHQSR